MKKRAAILLGVMILMAMALPAIVQKDDSKCKDHPLFPTRMTDYWIHHCDQKQFDSYSFTVAKGKKEAVEGQLWRISYYPQASAVSKPSQLQIQRNYENAVQKLGGTIVYSEKGLSTMKLVQEGKEIWVEVLASFTGGYGLSIMQKQGMAQDIVADAAAMANDINATGHVAVYGIYFDSGKSLIKPESAAAIAEIAKLLKGQPALKLFVVGHTDNEGGVESNITLSQDRAEAVLKALTGEHGIAPARLRSYGCGQFSPVASNDNDAGKAKNRRVELVKQ
ncbi:MAG: OmpA family protein [Acidobacteriota bacterium]|jgi:outer membrane protein OmpA-like peptidoglycan-associated protein|nr:OmpA family protein [Acidobacteriota bacterium]